MAEILGTPVHQKKGQAFEVDQTQCILSPPPVKSQDHGSSQAATSPDQAPRRPLHICVVPESCQDAGT